MTELRAHKQSMGLADICSMLPSSCRVGTAAAAAAVISTTTNTEISRKDRSIEKWATRPDELRITWYRPGALALKRYRSQKPANPNKFRKRWRERTSALCVLPMCTHLARQGRQANGHGQSTLDGVPPGRFSRRNQSAQRC